MPMRAFNAEITWGDGKVESFAFTGHLAIGDTVHNTQTGQAGTVTAITDITEGGY